MRWDLGMWKTGVVVASCAGQLTIGSVSGQSPHTGTTSANLSRGQTQIRGAPNFSEAATLTGQGHYTWWALTGAFVHAG